MWAACKKAGLTDREVEVANCLARELTASEIADKLAIATSTVRRHTRNIRAKVPTQGRSYYLFRRKLREMGCGEGT